MIRLPFEPPLAPAYTDIIATVSGMLANVSNGYGAWVASSTTFPYPVAISSVSYSSGAAAANPDYSIQIGYGPAGAEQVVCEVPVSQTNAVNVRGTNRLPVLSATIPAGARIAGRAGTRTAAGAGTQDATITVVRMDLRLPIPMLQAHPQGWGVAPNIQNPGGSLSTTISAFSTALPFPCIPYSYTCQNASANGLGYIYLGASGVERLVHRFYIAVVAMGVGANSVPMSSPFPCPVLPAGERASWKCDTNNTANSRVGLLRTDLPIILAPNSPEGDVRGELPYFAQAV